MGLEEKLHMLMLDRLDRIKFIDQQFTHQVKDLILIYMLNDAHLLEERANAYKKVLSDVKDIHEFIKCRDIINEVETKRKGELNLFNFYNDGIGANLIKDEGLPIMFRDLIKKQQIDISDRLSKLLEKYHNAKNILEPIKDHLEISSVVFFEDNFLEVLLPIETQSLAVIEDIRLTNNLYEYVEETIKEDVIEATGLKSFSLTTYQETFNSNSLVKFAVGKNESLKNLTNELVIALNSSQPADYVEANVRVKFYKYIPEELELEYIKPKISEKTKLTKENVYDVIGQGYRTWKEVLENYEPVGIDQYTFRACTAVYSKRQEKKPSKR